MFTFTLPVPLIVAVVISSTLLYPQIGSHSPSSDLVPPRLVASQQECQPHTLTIQPGSTLAQVAAVSGLPVDELRRTLHSQGAVIYAGQEVTIALCPEEDDEENSTRDEANTDHVVQLDETLASIADRHGVTPQALALFNGIRNRNLLRAGMRLRIPVPDAPPESP